MLPPQTRSGSQFFNLICSCQSQPLSYCHSVSQLFQKQMRFYPYTLLHGRYGVFQETSTTCKYIYIYHSYLFIYLFIHLFLFIYLFIYLIIYLIIYLHIVNFPIFIGFPSTCPWDPLVTNFHNLTKTIEHLDIFGAVFFFEVVFFLSISYIGFWKEAAVMTPFSNGHVKLVDWLPQSSLAVLKLY